MDNAGWVPIIYNQSGVAFCAVAPHKKGFDVITATERFQKPKKKSRKLGGCWAWIKSRRWPLLVALDTVLVLVSYSLGVEFGKSQEPAEVEERPETVIHVFRDPEPSLFMQQKVNEILEAELKKKGDADGM